MAEYIEREALLAEINSVIRDYADEHTFATDFAAAVVCELRDNVVAIAPAADVVKRERGEWKVYFSYGCWHYDCPFCGDGYATRERQKCPTNFCGECGADLRGETDA